MRDNLLRWQWSLYSSAHTQRRNLIIHALSTPLFIVGTLLILGAPVRPGLGGMGLTLMLTTLVAQGRGHRPEPTRPVGFQGAADFVTRFFAEQWVTFPRFVLSGGFARAWRSSRQA